MPGMSLQMSCSTGNVAHSGEADAAAAQARENVQPGMLGIMVQRDSTPAAAVAAGMVKSVHAAPGSAMHASGAVVVVVAVDVVVAGFCGGVPEAVHTPGVAAFRERQSRHMSSTPLVTPVSRIATSAAAHTAYCASAAVVGLGSASRHFMGSSVLDMPHIMQDAERADMSPLATAASSSMVQGGSASDAREVFYDFILCRDQTM